MSRGTFRVEDARFASQNGVNGASIRLTLASVKPVPAAMITQLGPMGMHAPCASKGGSINPRAGGSATVMLRILARRKPGSIFSDLVFVSGNSSRPHHPPSVRPFWIVMGQPARPPPNGRRGISSRSTGLPPVATLVRNQDGSAVLARRGKHAGGLVAASHAAAGRATDGPSPG
jgi:hypothetical protein